MADRPSTDAASLALEAPPQKAVVCLVAYAQDKRLTGTLEVTRLVDGTTAMVVTDRGGVAKIKTSVQVAFLANVLYELGYVEHAALTASLFELSKRQRIHGEILLAGGHVTAEHLEHALKEQTSRKLDHVLSLGQVAFAFHADVDLLASYGGRETIRVNPLPAIWRSVRDTPPEEHLRASLERVGQLPCQLVASDEIARFKFNREELALVECMRVKELSLDELRAMNIVAPRTAELLFYTLLITKQIEAGPPPSSRPVPPSSQTSQRSWTWRGPASALLQSAASAPPAPPSSRPSSRSGAPGPVSIAKALPLPVFVADGVFERARSILREDYFQRLGVARDASPGVIDAAFQEATRLWCGAAPPGVAGAEEAQETVVTALVEAHETLMNDELRRAYVMNQLFDAPPAQS